MSPFGERLRQLRLEQELTLRELENEIGISYSALGKYERNEREPDFNTLVKISSYYQVNIDWLLGNSELRTINEVVFHDDIESLEYLAKALPHHEKLIFLEIIRSITWITESFLFDNNTTYLEIVDKVLTDIRLFQARIFFKNDNPRTKKIIFKKADGTITESKQDFLSSHQNEISELVNFLLQEKLNERLNEMEGEMRKYK